MKRGPLISIWAGAAALLMAQLGSGGCTLDRAGTGSTPTGATSTTVTGSGGAIGGGSSSGGFGGFGGTGGTGGFGGTGGAPVCGNGIVEAGEQCDDGNQNNGDACPDAAAYGGTCQDATCGDGFLWSTDGGAEQCDDGDLDNTDSCPDDAANGGTCQDATCGDGFLWSTDGGAEQCDDGDQDNTDSCPDDPAHGGTCRDAMCGDGLIWSTDGGTEQCEDGDLDNTDSCPDDGPNGGTCRAATCGDGLVWSTDGGTEQCDDQGTVGGDGCSQTCVVECAGGTKHPSTHHCYRLFGDDRTWLEAQSDCRSLGAGWDLSSITSTSERNFLDDTVDPDSNVWIGGNDIAVEGTFEWSNGEPWVNPIWDSGEPNGNTSENCVELVEHNFGGNDDFNDLSCSVAQDYLCEMTPAGS